MRRMLKAGFFFLGVLLVLVACGGGGGGSTTTTSVALTSSKDIAVNDNTDAIVLTATVSPTVSSGTITYTVYSGIGTLSSSTGTISNGVASVQLISNTVGQVAVYATYGTTRSPLKTVNFAARTVSLASSSPAAEVGNSVALTGTVSPTITSGTMRFSVVSGTGTFLESGNTSYDATIGTNSQATATLTSGLANTVAVKTTYLASSVDSPTLSIPFANSSNPVILPTVSKSYIPTAADPLRVVASLLPTSVTLPVGTLINMNVAGGAGVIAVEGGTYGTSATPPILASGTYAGKAYVYLKSSDGVTTGDVTVTSTYGTYPTTSTVVTMLPETGTITKSVSLTASALTKIAGRYVTDIRFNITNNAASTAACYYKTITTPLALTLISQQNEANLHIVSLFTLDSAGVSIGATAPVKLVDVVYAFNPAMATLSIVPVSLTVSGGTSVTLDAADYLIQ